MRFFQLLIWLLVLTLGAGAQQRLLAVRCGEASVLIQWHQNSDVELYRCTEPFEPEDIQELILPISSLPTVYDASFYNDPHVASGTEYYYLAKIQGQWWKSPPIRVPQKALATSPDPWILVDKLRYCLEVHSHGTLVKRYPIALGAHPKRRKLRQDRASTPEGRYQIHALQPKAHWHKAYDLNYPNNSDRARHQLLDPESPIGGEIQIHGGDVDENWTWGCIALRNQDMDELFKHPEIGRGTIVWIVGSELTYQDLVNDEQSPTYDPLELGNWQIEHGLTPTCIWDLATQNSRGR